MSGVFHNDVCVEEFYESFEVAFVDRPFEPSDHILRSGFRLLFSHSSTPFPPS
jgi:hypothetical protein